MSYSNSEIEKLKEIATDKQFNLLLEIEAICEAKYTGASKEELFDFIGEWMPRMQLLKNLDEQISIPVYFARKEYNGNSVHGEWTEEYNMRNPVANEILKEHMRRGDMRGIDAMIEFAENCIKYNNSSF